ncbi:MAG: hypothetical protein ABFD92_13830 [Planctomycetaceae bacterium]|nr:hypothetical protein [Planctomycetaceae bacterium]
MTELQRFKAVVRFERPDYWPLYTLGGLGYIHGGGLVNLHRQGLPAEVNDVEAWCRFFGQATFDHLAGIGADCPGVKTETWREGGFEFVRSETGALTRQVIDNDLAYSMPDFIEFDVRDRASWEKYKELTTPRRKDLALLEDWKKRFAHRKRPLMVWGGGTWGWARQLMGPERALLAVYDDPALLQDMIDHFLWVMEEFTFPVLEALRPEAILGWEDFAYNHGMLISPAAFRKFCANYYHRVAEVAWDCGAELLIVDCDGKVDEFCPLLEEVGWNGNWPLEQVCGNPILDYRRRQSDFVFGGGIEKEIVNVGSSPERIERELVPRIPEMLEQGGFMPMFDHALQVDVSYENLCRCFTRLHEICGSPEDLGAFPRIY